MDEAKGTINAGQLAKFLDKLDIDVDKNSEALMTVDDTGVLQTGIVNDSKILLGIGYLDTNLPKMQIPVAHFHKLKDVVSTFKGDIEISVEDRLIMKGKNTKKVPLTRWGPSLNKIKSNFDDSTENASPVSLEKNEIDILTQDISIFDKITEVFFIVKDKQLTIRMIDDVKLESETVIDNVLLKDGEYIVPTLAFKILRKVDNIEIFFNKSFMYLRDKGDGYTVEYLLATKE